jgi:regulation of enolase protein 1 (concanavalin A-like superfamily)
LGALCLAMMVCSAAASAVGLRWNPNPEPDIANYRVNYGTSSGVHPLAVDAGLNTRVSITGLQEGTTYYFVVTAINAEGLESEPSDEVFYQVPVPSGGPVADSKSVSTQEDAPVGIVLSATATNPSSLTYAIVSGPTKGTLSGTAPNLTYTPSADFSGTDSFTYKANDSVTDSNIATVSITINPVNDAPVALARSATTPEDTPVAVTLSASDKEGQTLSYVIVSGPSKGSLSGNAPNLTYTPSADFSGTDSFTYKANDSVADSNIATVSITINPVNDAPVALARSATTPEDTPVAVTLSASDKEGQTLSYGIVSSPTKGSLSGTAPNLTYTPSADFSGTDSFTYKANDSIVDSNIATVSITINPVNDAPVALARSATTPEDTPVAVTLSASDKEGQTLSYVIVSGPSKGSLSGTAPNLTYTPAADFTGADSFTYKANDTVADSNIATVSITINPVNDAPVALARSATTPEDTPVAVTLSASDKEGQTLSYVIVSGPSKGSLSGTAPNLTYTPSADFSGTDSFTYKANDSVADSNIATVSITINPVNDAPVALARSATTPEDTPVAVTLSASDKEGQTLSYVIVSGPSKGTLSGTAPNLTYTPSADFSGTDSFTYKANDSLVDSNIATVSITIDPVNDAPVALATAVTTPEDTPVAVVLAASDKEGQTLGYAIVSGPENGTLSGTAPNLTYTPAADFTGADSFTYKANDSLADSNVAIVTITVSAVDDEVVAISMTSATQEDTPVAIQLAASDKDGHQLVYSIVSGPENGTLTGTAPDVTYTPAADFNGEDSFTFKVSAGGIESNIATVSIVVSPVNDAPVALAKSAATDQDKPVAIALSVSDKDGDPLTYSFISGPGAGTLTGDPPNLTYTPFKGYHGTDSFTFRVNDGTLNSALATVSIEIRKYVPPIDPALIARVGWSLHFVDNEDASNNPAVHAFDGNPATTWQTALEGGAMPPPHEIQINLGKVHTLRGFRYLPRQDDLTSGNIGQYEFYTSIDGENWGLPVASGTFGSSQDEKEVLFPEVNARFVRLVSLAEANGGIHCAVAELGFLGFVAINVVPVADPINVVTTEKTPVEIQLTGSDADNDPIVFSIVAGPADGTITGSMTDLVYLPRPGFTGVDSFTFRVSDGKALSNIAMVSITVNPTDPGVPNRTPSFKSNQLKLNGGTEGALAAGISLADTAVDPDPDDSIIYSKVAGPAWLEIAPDGSLSGNPPKGSRGTNRFTVRATDSSGAFAEMDLLLEIEAPAVPLPWGIAQIGASDPADPAAQKQGVLTVKGSGTLSGASDGGTFVWQTLSGDGEIIARVDAVKGPKKTARAGVMIRNSLAPNSKQVFVGVDGTKTYRAVSRTVAGKSAVTKAAGSGAAAQAWVRLVRKGQTISSFKSADGSNWKRVGATNVPLGRNCYIGISVSGGKAKACTAAFRNVKVKN